MKLKDLQPHAQAYINAIVKGSSKIQPTHQLPKAKRHGEFDSGLEARFGAYLIGLKSEKKGQFDFEHHPAPLIINGTQEYTADFRVGWIDWIKGERREVFIDTKGYNGRDYDRFRLQTAAWQHQDKEIYVVQNQGRGWTYLRIVPGAKTIQWKRGGKTVAPWEM